VNVEVIGPLIKRGHSHTSEFNPVESLDGSNACPTLGQTQIA